MNSEKKPVNLRPIVMKALWMGMQKPACDYSNEKFLIYVQF